MSEAFLKRETTKNYKEKKVGFEVLVCILPKLSRSESLFFVPLWRCDVQDDPSYNGIWKDTIKLEKKMTRNTQVDKRQLHLALKKIYIHGLNVFLRLVSRCGLAVRRSAGKQKDLGSIRFGSPFSSLQELWFMDTVLLLCPHI